MPRPDGSAISWQRPLRITRLTLAARPSGTGLSRIEARLALREWLRSAVRHRTQPDRASPACLLRRMLRHRRIERDAREPPRRSTIARRGTSGAPHQRAPAARVTADPPATVRHHSFDRLMILLCALMIPPWRAGPGACAARCFSPQWRASAWSISATRPRCPPLVQGADSAGSRCTPTCDGHQQELSHPPPTARGQGGSNCACRDLYRAYACLARL